MRDPITDMVRTFMLFVVLLGIMLALFDIRDALRKPPVCVASPEQAVSL